MATIQQVAEAFSAHRFAETYPFLHPQVRWTLVGAARLEGREQVVQACEAALDQLSKSTQQVLRFKTVVGPDSVAVDAITRYVDKKWVTTIVSSCDVFEFAQGHLTAITSYTVEIPAGDLYR